MVTELSRAHGCLVGIQPSSASAAGCGSVTKLRPVECEWKECEQPLPYSFRRKSVGLALSPFPLATVGILAETSDATC